MPDSYYAIGASRKFQDFILRWGTHYVKSAKFGGQLTVKKTAKQTTKLSTEEFASLAQESLKAMTSSLHNEYKQREGGFSLFGIGNKHSKTNQEAEYKANSNAKNEQSSEQRGSQEGIDSEFMNTVIEAKGGLAYFIAE